MIIDTHLHLIDRSALRYPWLAGVPALDHDFLVGAYAMEARRAGIAKSLHMEVDVDPAEADAETAYVQRLASNPANCIAGAIASCRPESSDFAAYLERQLANPFVKGFRRVLHVVPDGVSEGALFRENLKRMEGGRLTFDLCVLPHQVPKAIALADLAPGLQFVLDHCGNPNLRIDADHPWQQQVSELARRPNVVAKISGIITNADAANWSVDTLRPAFEHVVGAFGWGRVVWGSDWPVCTLAGTLSSWVAATHALLAGASDGERSKLLAGNANRLWSLPPQ